MGCFGNIIWMLCGGIVSGLSWYLAGILWCVTIVGIPVGKQCFKIASLSMSPFGKEIVYRGGTASFILNVFWMLLSGIPLFIEHMAWGILLCLSIVGIPFGKQQFKLAALALHPFGAVIR